MPDGWELYWFGSLNENGLADYDHDGVCNLLESQQGGDPYHGVWLKLSGGTDMYAEFAWHPPKAGAVTSYTYQINTTNGASWTNVAGVPDGNHLVITGLQPNAFYSLTLTRHVAGGTSFIDPPWVQAGVGYMKCPLFSAAATQALTVATGTVFMSVAGLVGREAGCELSSIDSIGEVQLVAPGVSIDRVEECGSLISL